MTIHRPRLAMLLGGLHERLHVKPSQTFVSGLAGSEAVGGLYRQGEAMKSWLHAAYTSI